MTSPSWAQEVVPTQVLTFDSLIGKMFFSQTEKVLICISFMSLSIFSFGEQPFPFTVLGIKSNPQAHFPTGFFVLKFYIR